MVSKKAQGMSITTIILLILGLVVLTVLILGFTMGWSSISSWLSTGDDIQQVQTKCAVACAQQNNAGFCAKKYDVTIGEDDLKGKTCVGLTDIDNSGIDDCPAISCDTGSGGTKKTCEELDGSWKDSCEKEEKVEGGVSDASEHEEQICCVSKK